MKIFAAFLVLLFSFSSVFPHSCAAWNQSDDKQYYKQLKIFDVIFYGEVTSIDKFDENYTFIVKFKVIRAWTGVGTS